MEYRVADCTLLLLFVPLSVYTWFSRSVRVFVAVSVSWPWGGLSRDMIDDLCTVVKVF